MENIKRACALGGVSVQGPPVKVETNSGPTIPFMFMNDRQERQPLKTVSFKEESSQDKVNESILKLTQMMERQFQLAEKQDSDSRSRGRKEREEIVGIEGLDHMTDSAHMIDQVPMTDQRVEKGQIVEIEVGIEMIEVVGTKVEIRVQEIKETIQVQDILQVCIVTIVK